MLKPVRDQESNSMRHPPKGLRPYSISPETSPEPQDPGTARIVTGWACVNASPWSGAFTCSPCYPRSHAAATHPLSTRPAIPSTDTWMIRAADTRVFGSSPLAADLPPRTSRSTARTTITAAPGSLECDSSSAAPHAHHRGLTNHKWHLVQEPAWGGASG